MACKFSWSFNIKFSKEYIWLVCCIVLWKVVWQWLLPGCRLCYRRVPSLKFSSNDGPIIHCKYVTASTPWTQSDLNKFGLHFCENAQKTHTKYVHSVIVSAIVSVLTDSSGCPSLVFYQHILLYTRAPNYEVIHSHLDFLVGPTKSWRTVKDTY